MCITEPAKNVYIVNAEYSHAISTILGLWCQPETHSPTGRGMRHAHTHTVEGG